MQSNTVSNANRTINAANNQQVVINSNGATFDIIKEIIHIDKTAYKDTIRFAPQLKGYTLKDTCKNVWEFVHNNITYKEDPNGYQYIKTPAALWSSKQGDCKSFAIFVGSILKNLGINYIYRFVSFDNGNYTHVYIVVPTGSQEIIIDTTINYFNTETQFKTKKDIPMTKIIAVSGVGSGTAGMVKIPISKFRIDECSNDFDKSNNIFTKQDALDKNKMNVVLSKEQLIKIYTDGKLASIGIPWSTILLIIDIVKDLPEIITQIRDWWKALKKAFSVCYPIPTGSTGVIVLQLNSYQINLIKKSDAKDINYKELCSAIALSLNSLYYVYQKSIDDYNQQKITTQKILSKNSKVGGIFSNLSNTAWEDHTDDCASYGLNTLATGLYSNLEQLEINLRQRLIDCGLLLGSVSQDDLFPKATDETNWLVARCIYKLAHPTYVWAYEDSSWINSMEVAVITNQTNNASTNTTKSNGYKKIILDSSGNMIKFNNASNGNTGTNDLGLPILPVIITYLNTLGKGTFTSNATGYDIIALLKSDGYNVPPTIMIQNDLYNWILANVKKTNNTSSSNTTTYLLVGGGVLAAFLLMGKKGKGRK